ncbi:MerR family transcriptional regulator [Spongiactinospora sp. 9N601]|uniref:MerR family transcriptional regulator n=1 Tax=Spongiactinospora sp. 9N601 TaxID=3375149 RepID=UPI00379B01C6
MTGRSIGDVAAEVGVSPQTLRVWEKQRLLVPDRTAGGQRRYRPEHVELARRIADLRQSHGWNPAAIRTTLEAAADSGDGPAEPPPSGHRLRRARLARGLSLEELAERTGFSASHLSSIERGVDRASTRLIAEVADALGIPMSGLAAFRAADATVVRGHERATIVLEGNVQWEELVLPGRDLEPALLTIPPHATSGGAYARPGETFAFVMSGRIAFRIGGGKNDHDTGGRLVEVDAGDAISLPSRTLYSWHNPAAEPARALWIELLSPQSWANPMTRRIVQAASGLTPPGDDA